MGDGQLYNFHVDEARGALSDRKKICLGTKPIMLRSFRSNGRSHVFAASDRPTVIYSANEKLLYSNVNENEVRSWVVPLFFGKIFEKWQAHHCHVQGLHFYHWVPIAIKHC